MIVIQTLLVYILLSIFVVFFCYVSAKQKREKWMYIAIAIYALVFGFRYGVGVDFISYKEIYECILAGRPSYYEFEPGFMFFIYLLTDMGFPSEIFFMLIAFFQIFFVFKGIDNKDIYPYLAFTFMAGCVWLTYSNGLRQQLVFCIFVYTLHFIKERKWIAYYSIIAICTTIHDSAWLMMILYPILVYREEWIKNIKLQYILLAISLAVMNINIIGEVTARFGGLIESLGYAHYVDDTNIANETYSNLLYKETEWGIGAFVILFINIFLIFWSNKIKGYYNSKFLTYSYNLFFIGVLWTYVFNNSSIFSRINYYFIGFQYIIAAYTLMYLIRTKKKQASIIMIILYLLLFVGYMYKMETNTTMFLFNWQDELFYLKKML